MFLFRRGNKSQDYVSEIFETMGRVFYEFGLVSDKYSLLAGRYQMPIAPRGTAILVSGWLKVPIKTDLLPSAVHLEDLQDDRLLSALKTALGRNVETRSAPVAPLPGLLWESKGSERYAASFDFWYFVELNSERLHGIARFYPFSSLPAASSLDYQTLPIPLGFSVGDKFQWFDLSYLTGTLVCGATNTGKSVFLRQVIEYLLLNCPSEVGFVLADFKEGVEFGQFSGRDRVLMCTSPFDLCDLVEGMYHHRYEVIKAAGCYSAVDFNAAHEAERLPYFLVIVDEFSEFILQGDKALMQRVQKLVSRTRGSGIYWMIGTQRPSVDIVPGSLKANLGSRISFSLASTIDAEVVFDMPDFKQAVRIGCPGRAWALVGDKILEFQASFLE